MSAASERAARHGVLLLAMALAYLPSHAQTSDESSRLDSLIRTPLDGAPSQASPLDLLLPAPIRAGYLTRSWVRDSLPPASDSLDDLARLDMIYVRAIGESSGDIGVALFASLIACFEHRTIPFSFGLHLPLTLEPQDAFERRVARLPEKIFADQPRGNDRDKLQHFFASASLAWGLDNAALADLAGLGIESGEAAFIAGGADDPRDVRANRLGQHFAELLRDYPHALPSVLFRAWNRAWMGGDGR
jgi:hypothetical protein